MASEEKNKTDLENTPPTASVPTEGETRKSEPTAVAGSMPPNRAFGAWIVIGLLIMLTIGMYFYKPESEIKTIDHQEFRQMVDAQQIKDDKVEWIRDPSGIMYLRFAKKTNEKEQFRVNALPSEGMEQYLQEKKIRWQIVYSNNFFGSLMREMLPIIIILGIIFFLFARQLKDMNSRAMGFGKSRAKMLAKETKKLTFANVAGITEAKEEVQEIVEFLKDPKKFQTLGGRIPKGVLLMGPPGTGKTLLAKAIAGEAGVPFFSISGSDFVEMFVGVGASRVRDMFDQGKKNAPCIIFIDEIDAVGRSRFSGIGGGHDEREQTLNALLVEMDGFETSEGVIIIAATNRADVLDPALLRPGRFDRQIIIDMPSKEGREDILKLHAQKVKLGPNADLSRIARGTPGFSGADLANLLNEAALLAARTNKVAIEQADLEEARDKVLWGRERRSRAMDDKERRITAWHEAGHALGATMSLPEKDVLNRTRNELLDQLVVLMGGRIAEQLHTGDISTGARMDIKMASDIAHKMVCSFGMADAFGFQSFGDNQEPLFFGREVTRSKTYSEETSEKIDKEVSRLVDDAWARAQTIIEENKTKLECLVERLIERETMDGREVEALLNDKPEGEKVEGDAATIEHCS
jgi:cell division protease FtsH